MKHSATVALTQKQTFPYNAFSFEGHFESADLHVTVMRAPDNVSRLTASLLDEEAHRQCESTSRPWVMSILAATADCEFLARLPKGMPVQISWKCVPDNKTDSIRGEDVYFAIDPQLLAKLCL